MSRQELSNSYTEISVNELFSGIGAQRKALEKIGVNFRIVGISEIDKYAIKSYEAIYGKTRNYGDISKVERLDYADLWTYSFPCTDISIAGKQEGINNNTRSGLLYQVQRLLDIAKNEELLPKYLLLENVKNLVQTKFKLQFDEWLKYLEQLGYKNYWQVLNAKDFGIPQNRERVFVVSIREDVKSEFTFPSTEGLKLRLQDLLEENVDEKFFIDESKVNKIVNSNFAQEKNRIQNSDVCQTLLARDYKDAKCVSIISKPRMVGGIGEKNFGNQYRQGNRVYDASRITMYCGASPIGNTGGYSYLYQLENNRIRKLTPLEYWRLMGFDDEDFYKAKNAGVSNTQLYKQAGNSIVVNVLEKIFMQLFNNN